MARPVVVVVLMMVLVIALPLAAAGGEARITGAIGPGTVRAGPANTVILEDVRVEGVTRVVLEGARSVTIRGHLELARGASLHIYIERAGTVEITGLTVSSEEPWTGLLIVEIHQCSSLYIDGLTAPNATFKVDAAGCGLVEASRVWDPLQSSGLVVAGSAVAWLTEARLGAVEISGAGVVTVTEVQASSLSVEALSSATVRSVTVSRSIAVRGVPPVRPSINIEGVESPIARIEGAGYTVARNIRAQSISFEGLGLAAGGVTALDLTAEARKLAIAGSTVGRVWTTAADVLVYNSSVDASRLGAKLSALVVWNTAANVMVFSSTLSGSRAAIFLGAPSQGEGGTASIPRYAVMVFKSTLLARSSYAILAPSTTSLLSSSIVLSTVEGHGLISAGVANATVLVAGSSVRDLSVGEGNVAPVRPLIHVGTGRVVIAASSVHLETPYVTGPSRGNGTINLVLARSIITAPPRIADQMANMIPGGVNLSLCLDPSQECSCGNTYSASFSAVGTPRIYGVEDHYEASPGVASDCPIDPLAACASLDYRYGNLTRLSMPGLPALAVYTLPGPADAEINGVPLTSVAVEQYGSKGQLLIEPLAEPGDRSYQALKLGVSTPAGGLTTLQILVLGVPVDLQGAPPGGVVEVTTLPISQDNTTPPGPAPSNVLFITTGGSVKRVTSPGRVLILAGQDLEDSPCYALIGPSPAVGAATGCGGLPRLPEPGAFWEWYALAVTGQASYDTLWGVIFVDGLGAMLAPAPRGDAGGGSEALLAVAGALSGAALLLLARRAVGQG